MGYTQWRLDGTYIAVCSCGWDSEPQPDRNLARRVGDAHLATHSDPQEGTTP